jgi:hypothetical protein
MLDAPPTRQLRRGHATPATRMRRISPTASITRSETRRRSDLRTFQHSSHIRLTSQELLPYNIVFGTHRNISIRDTKVINQHG